MEDYKKPENQEPTETDLRCMFMGRQLEWLREDAEEAGMSLPNYIAMKESEKEKEL